MCASSVELRADDRRAAQADRINRAVSNLLDNARKWSPAEGTVEVALRGRGAHRARSRAGLRAEPICRSCSTASTARDGARRLPGSGLGLAIVRQAAEACGGYAEAENAPDGGALLRSASARPCASPRPRGMSSSPPRLSRALCSFVHPRRGSTDAAVPTMKAQVLHACPVPACGVRIVGGHAAGASNTSAEEPQLSGMQRVPTGKAVIRSGGFA